MSSPRGDQGVALSGDRKKRSPRAKTTEATSPGGLSPLRPGDPADGSPYAAHILAVRSCTRCPTVFGPPVVGPAPGAKIILIGQAPGPREQVVGHPFAWTAGRALFGWLSRLGVDEGTFRARVHMAAVVRCFPGRVGTGDRVPSPEEVAACFPFVAAEVAILEPQLILPIGRLAIDRFLTCTTLSEVIGSAFDGAIGKIPVTVIPLPHPSGRSTWLFRAGNRALLDRALALIGAHPAWRTTFGPQAARSAALSR
jgi:uracil-DNA glycosylase